MSRALYRLFWIPSALAIVAMAYLFATMPMPLPVPGPMKHYVTGDRSLRVAHPGNWKARETGSHAVMTQVAFTPTRDSLFTVTMDLQGSLMADVMKSSSSQASQLAAMVPGADSVLKERKSPLEALHEAAGINMKSDRETYPHFVDGATSKRQIAGAEAFVTSCTWEAPGLFGSRLIVGRRVTLLSRDSKVTVVYGCPREMRRIVLPVFDQMLESMEFNPHGGSS